MTDKQTGGPAFPLSHSHKELEGTNWQHVNGMTLRDYFAAKAMHHWLSLPIEEHQRQKVAVEAYKVADAMLKAREK